MFISMLAEVQLNKNGRKPAGQDEKSAHKEPLAEGPRSLN